MRIATFGCSWTHGVDSIDDNYSWPEALGELYPTWEIDNYAIAGTSLQFSIWLCNKIMNRNLEYDKIVFQITSPRRLTYYHSNGEEKFLEENFFEHRKNYKRFGIKGLYNDVQAITPSHVAAYNINDRIWRGWHGDYAFTDREKAKFARLYYKKMSPHILNLEYQMFIEWIETKVDLCFFHTECPPRYKSNLPIIRNEASDNWNNFIADNGDHFGKEGCQWQAKWVAERL